MKRVLNLVDPTQSSFKVKINNYPDGQVDLQISNQSGIPFPTAWKEEGVEIKARLNNFEDLNLILVATQALRRLGAKDISLFIGCLLGQRSDRQFVEGGVSYLVDIVAPILNSQGYSKVTVLDPHNPDVTAACIKNLEVKTNHVLVSWAIDNIYQIKNDSWDPSDKFILVSPDGGALKKIYQVADYLGPNPEVIICSKSRDTEGKLSKTEIPALDYPNITRDLILVDDCADGGRTFINIAKAFRGADYKGRLFLIVTHGIFSAGISELSTHINKIYCTNSISQLTKDKFGNDTTKLITQMNVF